ncbi:hypothetical protein D3C71_1871230 [compost metagenome]
MPEDADGLTRPGRTTTPATATGTGLSQFADRHSHVQSHRPGSQFLKGASDSCGKRSTEIAPAASPVHCRGGLPP